jgi:hypothetical protein
LGLPGLSYIFLGEIGVDNAGKDDAIECAGARELAMPLRMLVNWTAEGPFPGSQIYLVSTGAMNFINATTSSSLT